MSISLSTPVTLPLVVVLAGGVALVGVGGWLFRPRHGPGHTPGAALSRYGGYNLSAFGCSPGLVFILLALVAIMALLWPSVTKGVQLPSMPQVLAAVQPPSAPGSVVGGPSLSAAFVDHILSAAGSPAEAEPGMGTYVYQLSQQYHVDDAYALAFFHHESSYGRAGVARETNSWGNIKCTPGWPRCDSSGDYRAYPTWHAGVLDWFQTISSSYVQHGLTTLNKILPVYAPPTDNNDDAAYEKAVLADVARWRQGVETP
jgi:hypothetical protein